MNQNKIVHPVPQSVSVGTLEAVDEESGSVSSNEILKQEISSINSAQTSISSVTNFSVARGEETITGRLRKYGIVQMHRERTVPISKIRTAPLHVRNAVEEIHRWLFVEGGHFDDVQGLMTEYSEYVRDFLDIPLDRLFYGGIGLHPKLTAYLWRWEPDSFDHREMPQEVFERRNELFSPDEPFCVLEQGRADFVRIRATDEYIPPDTEKWFRGDKYQDYYALPDIHRGECKGGLAWSTKHEKGFTDDHIQFFELTLPALTTVMRLHTNDLVLKTLTDRMEKEIDDRTSELARANQELEVAGAQIAKHASKQLEHFACMSHEIRTPLNCVVGLSSLLMESDNLQSEHVESIQMINANADLLKCVVDDVLDYAKLESGSFEVNIQPTNLQETLDSVVYSIRQKMRARNIRLRTLYAPDIPDSFSTDARRLQQVLFNLLGNAEKFSKVGGIVELAVTLQKDDGLQIPPPQEGSVASGDRGYLFFKSKNVLRFTVKDYGKGIDKKDFRSIFNPFSQASKETQSVYGGTGLGLSITSKLVQRLGGSVSVDSEVDVFTSFFVDLPFDGEPVDFKEVASLLENTSIVMLRPEEQFSSSLSMEDDYSPLGPQVVRAYDLHVLRCLNWEDVDKKVSTSKSRRHHAFIVDKSLCDKKGYEKIKERLGAENCTLFTTGVSSEVGAIEGRHFKSLSANFPARLLKSISKHVADDRKAKVREEPISTPMSHFRDGESASEDVTLALKEVKVLYADDNLVNQKVLMKMLNRIGLVDVDVVDDGLKAVNLCKEKEHDVIFMDMQMPVMDGVEACKHILKNNPQAQVIFVTAHTHDEYTATAADAGGIGYISKPFNLKEIESVVKKYAKAVLSKERETSTSTLLKTGNKSKSNYASLTVLYAEDNLINQKVLCKVLEKLGVAKVDVVDNGRKAVDITKDTSYDVIFMDIQMPVMDGLEACKHIVKRDPDAKVVFVTAHALDDFRKKADEAGGIGFVSKPINMKKIEAVLQSHIANE